ncbi:peptidase S41-like protein [Dysgonomonas alginatilytica]|uniref:Peptidase S41-like protein n=1 Tax=Dysgonomonas alginatilytica TaxID=1605892 RepID=A0A2V3PST8_9BACT|nr:S41 family peptidase [Dysgonomonas alginatilytica]PXV65508.1 peptidase S41-like protein [Dysgonomonas alginatilytica]
MRKKLFTILTIVLGTMFMVSCGGDDPKPNPISPGVNEDILGIMNRNYLWALPAEPNIYQETEPFFTSLLHKNDVYTDGGKTYNYSRISAVSNQTGTVYDPGFEYAINNYTGGVTYYVILYVKPGTSAADYLLRGLYITTVNGTAVTAANASTLLYDAYSKGADVKLSIRTPQITAERTITIKPYANYVEAPLHTAKMLTAGTQKVGYVFYNHFSSSTPGTSDYKYDNALAAQLNKFKTDGVTTLVFDLRYNSGGGTAAIQALGSALTKSRDTTKPFIEQLFRADLPKPNIPLNFVDKTGGNTDIPKLGDQLQKIYIITGQSTAGIPEAFINALKAYRSDIVLVGEATKGRAVATSSTQDASKQWNLRLALSYLADVNKKYDYNNKGFTPNTIIKEVQANADANSTILGEMGTDKEIILSQILEMINGKEFGPASGTRSSAFDREVKTSLFRRPGANESTIDLINLN